MDERGFSILERIAVALESIAAGLSPSNPDSLILFSEDEWENRDLEVLYAELAEDDPDGDDEESWDYDPGFQEPTQNWEREYFDAMTDGMAGDYDDFAGSGGNIDWIDDWAGR